VSGNAAVQGGTQKGEGRHLFAPMGFLDDSWFHRSYWVYGKNFAGGHNGYFQAGKYTPEGRILVHDDKNVFGYSRLPQYYKWTTTMEHQLFSASKEAPDVEVAADQRGAVRLAPTGGRNNRGTGADGENGKALEGAGRVTQEVNRDAFLPARVLIENKADDAAQARDFAAASREHSPGMFRELLDFLRCNKKWWLIPIIVVLLLVGVLVILGGTAAAPFIYTLF
jgi:hypothetical protein